MTKNDNQISTDEQKKNAANDIKETVRVLNEKMEMASLLGIITDIGLGEIYHSRDGGQFQKLRVIITRRIIL